VPRLQQLTELVLAIVIHLYAPLVAAGSPSRRDYYNGRSGVARRLPQLKVSRHPHCWVTPPAQSWLAVAANAVHASNADHATKADHAVNSDQLAGSPASSYVAHCPNGLKRAPKSDLCFDFTTRTPATWTDALKTCALAGLRLPDPGELVQAFNDVDALQQFEWTGSQFQYLNPNGTGVVAAVLLAQDSSRKILVNADLITRIGAYRCVTTATN
jgi:hypothetical protein